SMIRSVARSIRNMPPYPILFTLAWAIGVFTASGEPLAYFWRPLLVTLAPVLVSLLAIRLANVRRQAATLGFTAAWFTFLVAWWIVLPLLGIVAWRLAVDWWRRRTALSPIREGRLAGVTRIANYFSVVLLAVTMAGMLLTFNVDVPPARQLGDVESGAPDVYLLMLDGYPRSDTLAELGIDNAPFLADLESRGFDVSDHSRSNYNTTMLSLPALFDGAYVAADDGLLPPMADREAWELRKRSAELQQGRMLDAFRAHGYRVATVPNVYGATALLTADDVLDHPYLNQLENRFIHLTFLEQVIDALSPHWIRDQWAASVENVFRQAQAFSLRDRGWPALFFAHVISPHPPVLFDSDGRRPDTSACRQPGCGFGSKLIQLGLSLDQYAPLLAGQIAYLNSRVLTTIDTILDKHPDAVILVFSDHGARFSNEITDEYFHSFFAARTPGHQGLYSDAMSLTNTLPILLNAYFDAAYPVLPSRAWESDDNTLTGLRERSVGR
ncbi:MAG TPA: sulfatase-like hydrolase/transferase, partial [Rhodothermales bacterium]